MSYHKGMKSNLLLLNILKEINSSPPNLDPYQIVFKHLKDVEVETIIDTQDLLLRLQKSLETCLFSSILDQSASVDQPSLRW